MFTKKKGTLNFEKGYTVHIGTHNLFFWYTFVYHFIFSKSFDNNYYLRSIIDFFMRKIYRGIRIFYQKSIILDFFERF